MTKVNEVRFLYTDDECQSAIRRMIPDPRLVFVPVISASHGNRLAVIDIDDAWRVLGVRWGQMVGHRKDGTIRVYADSSSRGLMHRLVADCRKGFVTDHINGNRMDNRRCNLRTVTQKINAMNRMAEANSHSTYLGVGWDKSRDSWVASLMLPDGGYGRLGRYYTQEEAAWARDQAALKWYGHEVRLNGVQVPADGWPQRPVVEKPQRLCSLPTCDLPHSSRGFCRTHVIRWRLYGDPFADIPIGRVGCKGMTLPERRAALKVRDDE